MATVTIDIPGIGTVEAENAASESTLRELVNLMKKGGGSGGRGSGGRGSGSGSGGGTSGGAGGGDKQSKELKNKTDKFLYAAGAVTKSFANVGEAGSRLVSQFANMGDSLESAAGIFSSIPVVGSMFALVASSASKVADSFVAGAASGATFDGSIRTMSESASQAGMTLDQFGGFLAQNGAALVALGGETSSGAKRFSTLSRQIRDSGQDLFSLGYSTQTINEGFANYAKQLRMQGLSQRKTDNELIQGTQEYLKEMDQLAKITGEERKVKEAERERLLQDAQFQASMAGLNEDVRKGFLNVVQQMPSEAMADFAKDIMATGTATTKENQLLMSQMPKSAAMLQDMNRKMQRGEAVTAAERDRLNDLMAQEGPKALQQIKFAGAASQDLSGVVKALASTQNLQMGGVQASINAQKKSTDSQEKLNEEVQKARAGIAELSNSFLVAISESGGLPQLMEALKIVAGLVQDYVLPAFIFLAERIDIVLGVFVAYKALMLITNGIISTNNFLMKLTGKGLVSLGSSLASAITGMIKWTAQLVMSMGRMAIAALTALPGMIAFAAGALAAAAPFLLVAAAVAGVVLIFKAFGGDLEVVKLAFNTWWQGLKMWFNALKLGFYELLDFIPGLDYSKEIAETKEAIGENAKTMVENVTAIKERMADNREKSRQEKEEKKKQKEQEKKQKEEEKKVAKAETAVKKDEVNSVKNANKELDKERQKNVDYNTTDTVSLLKQEAIAQNSGFAQINNPVASADLSKTVNSLAGAEEIKGQVVSEKEKEKEETKRKNTAKKGGKKTEEAPITETAKKADTSSGGDQNGPRELLAALNTKMDALIRVAGAQLQVQRGMSNDLYNA